MIKSKEEIMELAKQIEKGELKETKEILMLQDDDGWSVAHRLAYWSDKTGWETEHKDIKLQDDDGWSVAHWLAYCSNKTNWEIAMKIEKGELAETKELLMKSSDTGWTVAHWLASNSGKI